MEPEEIKLNRGLDLVHPDRYVSVMHVSDKPKDGGRMLDVVARHEASYLLLSMDNAIDESRLDELEALFDRDIRWTRRDGDFYRCFNADVSEHVDRAWLRQLAQRMVDHTGIDLTYDVHVAVQRMEPGDQIGRHSDRPLLGYEVARLVLQLERDWAPADGGLFSAIDDGQVVFESYPARNRAAAFALTVDSLHEVSLTRRQRRSLVFSFGHIGNTSAVEQLVHGLFGKMCFAELPDAVSAAADSAEGEYGELDTHRASSVAAALVQWGYPPRDAAAGYRLALSEPAALETDLDGAVALARWLSRLHVDDFDIASWEHLRGQLACLEPERDSRMSAAWRVAFPAPAD